VGRKKQTKNATVSEQCFVHLCGGNSSIDFRLYILGFCVAIYFHKNSSAVVGIVARIDAVHGIPAWDG